jgi:hypothetical protein
MKKLYLSIPLLIVGFFSQAQIKEGTTAQIKEGVTLLGANFSVSTTSDKPDGVDKPFKSTSLGFSPSFARAIRDNLVLGVDLSFSYGKAPSQYQVNQLNSYGAGFFLRKYKTLGAGFFVFGQARVAVSYQDNQTDYSGGTTWQRTDQRNLGGSLAFAPGIAYAISRRWQLETSVPNLASISYNHFSSTTKISNQPDSHDRSDTFGVTSTGNYILSLGLRYVIGG